MYLLSLYVHCTVGASRAPTMVMAYFIQVRKIALLDIFKYLQSIRTVVEPNKHFLFQLAELEVNSRGVIVMILSRILLTQLLVCVTYFPRFIREWALLYSTTNSGEPMSTTTFAGTSRSFATARACTRRHTASTQRRTRH